MSDKVSREERKAEIRELVRELLKELDAEREAHDFLKFAEMQAEWSQATFGTDAERGPVGPLKHLGKEVQEALAHIDDPMEYVDCFFLVLDAARRAKIPANRLLELAFEKLEINKARKWSKPTSDDPVEHDRTGEERNSSEQTIREQCAKIAEDYGRSVPAARMFADRIAAAIRSGE